PASAAAWPPPAARTWRAGRARANAGSFDLRAHAGDALAELPERLAGLVVQRQEPGGAEELQQRLARVGVVAGFQQHLAQAVADARIEIASHHFQRPRERRALGDDTEVAAVGRRDPRRVVPVEVADRAGVHQALVHPGRDVEL